MTLKTGRRLRVLALESHWTPSAHSELPSIDLRKSIIFFVELYRKFKLRPKTPILIEILSHWGAATAHLRLLDGNTNMGTGTHRMMYRIR